MVAHMDVEQQVQILLEPLDDDSAAKYFQELAGGHGVEVRLNVDGKGKGIIALKDVAADELVFTEPPLVAGQHATNRQDALVCSHCFSMIGSIEQQIAHRLLARASAGSDAINPDYLRSLWAGASRLPYSERFPLPSLVNCLGGCTDTQYCSQRCAKADWAAHHALLCSGPAAQPPARAVPQSMEDAEEVTRRSSLDRFREAQAQAPAAGMSGMTPNMLQVPRHLDRAGALRAFRAHADATNDIFHLAGQLIARVVLHAERLLASGVAAGSRGGQAADPRACWEALQRAWRPFAAAWKAPWWDCVSEPEDVPNAAAFRRDLRRLAEESLELLKACIYDARFPALFSLEVYGSIIGMFELNNLSLYVASPVEDYFLLIHLDREEGGLAEGERNLAQLVTKALLEGLGESYEASCEGSAFYALQSCCNHSCAPNAHAFKRYGRDTDGSAVILAKRDIRAGEEVCMAYIDESQSYAERQAALRDYGFTCTCSKCSEEAAAPGKGKAAA